MHAFRIFKRINIFKIVVKKPNFPWFIIQGAQFIYFLQTILIFNPTCRILPKTLVQNMFFNTLFLIKSSFFRFTVSQMPNYQCLYFLKSICSTQGGIVSILLITVFCKTKTNGTKKIKIGFLKQYKLMKYTGVVKICSTQT